MGILTNIREWVFTSNFNDDYELIKAEYSLRLVKEKVPTLVIFCLDGRTSTVGLADRLKGMISCYAYAKAINVPYRIEHIVPFDLADFWVPNNYDWRLKTGEKSYNLLYANPVSLLLFRYPRIFGQIPIIRRRKYQYFTSMRLFRINKKRQHHLYSNNLSYIGEINKRYHKNYTFGELFQELFKPSSLLEKKINEQGIKKGEYISVSFRFMQLLGDFKDVWGDILSVEDRIDLINRSVSIVQSLYQREQKSILVTSDSHVFIDAVSTLNYVYIIPGKIGHIGWSGGNEIYEKTFLDFYMISQASHVYMAHSGKMWKSAFAKTAAMTTNTPYDEISY